MSETDNLKTKINYNFMSNSRNIDQLFSIPYSYAYDDIIFLPDFIDFTMDNISLETNITKNIKIKIPLVSSPMDTVTESSMAIKMALLGGLGIIHCNNTVLEQAEEVRKVKRSESGMILDPITLNENASIGDALRLMAENKISNSMIDKQIAIIRSMTKKERADPDIIKASRKIRISKGSGTKVQDVNRLLKQFLQSQKMMKRMKSMGKGGIPSDLMQKLQGNLPPNIN